MYELYAYFVRRSGVVCVTALIAHGSVWSFLKLFSLCFGFKCVLYLSFCSLPYVDCSMIIPCLVPYVFILYVRMITPWF